MSGGTIEPPVRRAGWRPTRLRHHARLNDLLRRNGSFLTIVGSLSGRGTRRSGASCWEASKITAELSFRAAPVSGFCDRLIEFNSPHANDVVANVTSRGKGYAALNSDFSEVAKIQIQIFELRGACKALGEETIDGYLVPAACSNCRRSPDNSD